MASAIFFLDLKGKVGNAILTVPHNLKAKHPS